MSELTKVRGAARPAVWIAVGLLCGIFASAALEITAAAAPWLLIGGVAACGAGAFVSDPRFCKFIHGPLLAMLSAMLGAVCYESERAAAHPAGAVTRLLRDSLDAETRDDLVAAVGIVASPVWSGITAADGTRSTQFILQLEGLRSGNTLVAARGSAGVRVDGPNAGARAGDRVEIVAKPKKLTIDDTGARRCMWLATKRGAVRVLPSVNFNVFAAAADRAREQIAAILQSRLRGPPLGVAAALTIGTYYYLPQEVLEAHCDTGAIPHLAISGSHVVMVCFALGWIAKYTLPRKLATPFLCLSLLLYGPISGGASPTIRAVCAALLAQTAALRSRRGRTLQLLACGATLEALLDPMEVLGPSFQLSYGAILGFICFYSKINDRWRRLLKIPPGGRRHLLSRMIVSSFILGLAALLSTAGIVIYHFERLPWVAPLVGLPLAFLIPPMLLFSWLAILPGAAGDACARLFEAINRWEWAVVDWASDASSFYYTEPIAVTAAALAILSFMIGARKLAFAAGAAAALFFIILPLPSHRRDSLQIIIHDVGHGLAVTCVTPDGQAVQLDAGSADLRRPSRNIINKLADLHILQFAACSISHADADHANAFPRLLQSIKTERWIANPENPWCEEMAITTQKPRTSPGPLSLGNAQFEWIAVRAGASSKDNDTEVATILQFGGRRILFPGDLELDGVRELWKSLENCKFDIVLLPHHGLDNGQIATFLASASPRLAVASCGGRYSTKTAERALAERGLPLFTTKRFGTLTIEIRDNGEVVLRGGRR